MLLVRAEYARSKARQIDVLVRFVGDEEEEMAFGVCAGNGRPDRHRKNTGDNARKDNVLLTLQRTREREEEKRMTAVNDKSTLMSLPCLRLSHTRKLVMTELAVRLPSFYAMYWVPHWKIAKEDREKEKEREREAVKKVPVGTGFATVWDHQQLEVHLEAQKIINLGNYTISARQSRMAVKPTISQQFDIRQSDLNVNVAFSMWPFQDAMCPEKHANDKHQEMYLWT
ncbi:hypothetical protein R3P38DRAFT_2813495 [Favolaschia claudopus]|uniref:Uncharacterized protein n=1 Tax=Favolaschia claudopus TaxID=2862362 RepID=A0AAV9Z572_9AGAR